MPTVFLSIESTTTEMYTLSLHDALPILPKLIETYEILQSRGAQHAVPYMMPSLIPNMAAGWISMRFDARGPNSAEFGPDRKSTRLNSSHVEISYAVSCLKKKNNIHIAPP